MERFKRIIAVLSMLLFVAASAFAYSIYQNYQYKSKIGLFIYGSVSNAYNSVYYLKSLKDNQDIDNSKILMTAELLRLCQENRVIADESMPFWTLLEKLEIEYHNYIEAQKEKDFSYAQKIRSSFEKYLNTIEELYNILKKERKSNEKYGFLKVYNLFHNSGKFNKLISPYYKELRDKYQIQVKI